MLAAREISSPQILLLVSSGQWSPMITFTGGFFPPLFTYADRLKNEIKDYCFTSIDLLLRNTKDKFHVGKLHILQWGWGLF